MNKRKLTLEEIDFVLDFIKPNKSIPEETALSVTKIQKDELRKQLINQEVNPKIIPELKTEIEKNYMSSLITPGESVGIICAQSIGEKQTQNSVSCEAEVLVKYNNKIKRIKIGEFIDNYFDEHDYIDIGDESFVQKCSNVSILSITKNEKMEWRNVTEVSRHAPKGDLIRVTTESGRNVITTLSHSHLHKKNLLVEPILGSSLKVGDKIPVMKRCPKPEFETDIFSIPIHEDLKIDIELNENLMWFFGVFIANGEIQDRDKFTISCTNNFDKITFETNVSNFSNNNKIAFEKRIKKNSIYDSYFDDVDSFFQYYPSKILSTLSGTVSKKEYSDFYIFYSKIYKDMLNKLCEVQNFQKDKRVPEIIFGTNVNNIKVFIKSWVKEKGYVSDSKKLLEDFVVLFSYFGIYSKILEKKIRKPSDKRNKVEEFSFYRLQINIMYNDIFNEMFDCDIPCFILEEKEYILKDDVLNTLASDILGRNIKIDNYSKLHYLLVECEIIRDLIENKEKIDYFNQVYNSDVTWEKIISIELIDEKDYICNYSDYVYDFSVEGNETFALFSGIVVHNTLNTLILLG
jgi:hypothetical protein